MQEYECVTILRCAAGVTGGFKVVVGLHHGSTPLQSESPWTMMFLHTSLESVMRVVSRRKRAWRGGQNERDQHSKLQRR